MTNEEKRLNKNAYQREWNKKNRDKKREMDKKYRENNKEKIKEIHKLWREKNIEKIREQARDKYKENPKIFKERKKKYIENNIEKVKEQRRIYKMNNKDKIAKYEREKRKNNPKYRLKSNLNSLIGQYRRRYNYTGNKTIKEMLGCDIDFFVEYLEGKFKDEMTLDNYGEWTIDHIIPISQVKTQEDIEKLNHYTNLQPLWAKENSSKGKKIL